MIGTPLVDSTMADSSALASGASAGSVESLVVHPDVEAALRRNDVGLDQRRCRRRQQVRHLDLRALTVRVLNQIEQVEVAERGALGEVPRGGRTRQDAPFGVAAVRRGVPRHRPVGHDLDVGFDQRRELGGLEAGDRLGVDRRAAHRRHHTVIADGRAIGRAGTASAPGPASRRDWRSPAACRRRSRSRPRPGT